MSSSKKFKFFRDPIHGYIEVDEGFLGIIDSPIFQRLRRIKQLAFCDLVYHGAEHSRFGHSLGTYHLASILADKFGIKGNIRNEFRLAALLHDIGHPPLSHAFESALESAYNGSGHENYTESLILHSEIGDKIDDLGLDKNTVAKLIRGRYVDQPRFGYLNDLISSELDVDRLDFLFRDSYYCGVPYGRYDLERLLLSLDRKRGEVVVQEKGRHAVESFVLSRFYMYTQVYTHHTRRAFDVMLKAIFTKDFIKRIGYPKHTAQKINELIHFDDNWLLSKVEKISGSEVGTQATIAKCLVKREHIRPVIEKIAYADVESKAVDPIFTTIDALESFKNELATEIGIQPDLIFFDRPWKDLPFERKYRQYYSSKEEEGRAIKMLLRDGKVMDVASDISSLAYHISKKLAQVIRVYTVKEKRDELGKAMVQRHPELKGFLIK